MADPMVEKILDAALEAATIHGVTRTSMSDVASRAGISRPTLYKRFGSKDELVAAVVVRETNRMIQQVLDAIESLDDPTEALRTAAEVALRAARDHPLLDRIVRTEPETLVPILVADPSPIMGFARDAIALGIRDKVPELSELSVRRASDILIRLLVSYSLTPPDDPPEVVAASIATLLATALSTQYPIPSADSPEHR